MAAAQVGPTIVNIHDAKTHLSRLLVRAEAGEEIVIARAGKPIVALRPVAPRPRIEFGFLDIPDVPDGFFFDPLSEEELAEWA